jgi:5'(3')-deoxyribonucleotidase
VWTPTRETTGTHVRSEKTQKGDSSRIALDLDGVLADLHSVLLEKFSKFANRRITADMITRWDIAENIKPGLASSYDTAWDDYRAEQISPYEANVGFLVDRIRRLALVDIVTAHAESSRSKIERWLTLNRVPYDRLVLVGKGDGSHKLSVIGEYDVFIDDNPNLAENAPSSILVLLYSQPWNQQVHTPNENRNVIRIHSLREVPELLGQLSIKKRDGTK